VTPDRTRDHERTAPARPADVDPAEPVAAQPAADRASAFRRMPVQIRFHRIRPWLATLARLVLAGVLAAAGWLKLMDPDASVRAVAAYRLLPELPAKWVGLGLPLLELALALLLALGLGTRLAAAITAVLMVVFICGIASVWIRGIAIECGCFGGGGTVAANQTAYLTEILRDTGLLVLAAGLARWPFSRLSMDAWLGVTTPPAPRGVHPPTVSEEYS